MKKIVVEDLCEIAELMYCDISEGNHSNTTFAGHYEDAVEVIKHLLMFDDTLPYHISVEPVDWNDYDKEYFVTLDADMDVWCTPAYDCKNNSYIVCCTDCFYIADDCNSALLKKIYCPKDKMYEISYDLDDECDGDCECCHCCDKDDDHEIVTRVAVDEDGTIRGFEKSWSTHEDGMYYHSTYSHYSSDPDMLKKLMDDFDIEF